MANESSGLSGDWLFYPFYLHLHFKKRLPYNPQLNQPYPLEFCLSNEIDMFRSIDITSESPLLLQFNIIPSIFKIKILDGRPIIDKNDIPELVYLNVTCNNNRIISAVQTISLSKDKIKQLNYDGNTNEHDHMFQAGKENIIIKEIAGREVGCRIWDCAIYVHEYLLTILKANPLFFNNLSVLDLGSGNGFVAIWLSKYLEATESKTEITCSDLEELQDLMNLNITRSNVNVTAKVLNWGEPCNDRYDFIIASDVVYQPALFPALLTTLSEILSKTGKILLIFRSRGKDEDHKNLFFDLLPQYGLKFRDAKNPSKISNGRCFFNLLERI